MKRVLYLIAIATAIFAFSACQKDELIEVVENVNNRVTFTFTAEKVAETKTAAVEGDNGASYIWTDEDVNNIHLIQTVPVEEGEGTQQVLVPSEDVEVTKEADNRLTISATVDEADSYTFRAILAKSLTSRNHNPKTQTAQSPNGLTSFDPNADVLVSEEITTDSPSEMLLHFSRKAVINKMTIKGLPQGTLVSKVIISSTKNLAGSYSINGETFTGSSPEITLNYNNQALDANGQFPVYFVSIPNTELTLTVKVFAGNMVYYKTFGGSIQFNQGSFTRFSVNNLTGEVNSPINGTYILANTDGSFIASAYANGNYLPAVQTIQEVGDNTHYYDPDVVDFNAAKVTLIKEMGSELYTMTQNGKYLYAAGTGTANHLKATTAIPDEDNDGYYWTISLINGEWTVIANSNNHNTLQFNDSNSIFSCYESANYAAIAFLDPDNFAPTPVITAEDITLSGADAVSTQTDLGARFNSISTTITANAFDNEECTTNSTWLTVNNSGSGTSARINYTATANNTGAPRTAYVVISATNAGRTVSRTIAVTQPVVQTVTDYIDRPLTGVTNGSSNYSVWSNKTSNSDAIYAGNSAGSNNTVQLRSSNNNSGVVSTTSGGKVKKIVVTWNSSTSSGRTLNVYGSNTAYVSAADLYDSSTQGTLLGTIVYGTSTELEISGDYTYIGLRSANNTLYLNQIAIMWEPTSGSETVYSITVNQPTTEGCTISATPTTPQTEGTTISLEVTATASGYEFSEWVVKDANNNDVTVSNNAFIMPASNVTVSAIFTESGAGDIPTPERIDFSTLGLTNGVAYNDPFSQGHFTVTFAPRGNDGKYYNSGTAIRVYGGGSFNVSSSIKIFKIEFTFGAGEDMNSITSDVGSFSSTTWTGEAYSINFTIGGTTGHRRIKAIKVYYSETDEGLNSYVLEPTDVDNVNAYTTNTNTVTAADGSSWTLTGYGATDNIIQLGKGGANYILTPSCSGGISSIVVTCTSSYYLAVVDNNGNEIEAKQPNNGSITFDLSSGSYTQVKLIARRQSGNSNAAVNISKVEVFY